MSKTVADMTTEEPREMVSEIIEIELAELFGDPDQGAELRDLRQRLEQQRSAVQRGERGEPFRRRALEANS